MSTKCDNCGLCCTELIIEVDPLDVLREPRIAAECPPLDGNGSIPIGQAQWSVACGAARRCPFHVDQRCTIYPTRPNVCLAFQAGSEKCRELRRAAGLADLPEVEDETVVGRIQTAFRDYDEDDD